ncbi:MAG TPA: glycoside hydrolase family 3 C-terminal domain-containing protein [Trebonia sp.]|jgi:beta-glucosidase
MTTHSHGAPATTAGAPATPAAGETAAAPSSDRDTVDALPVAAKVRLLTGADSWRTHGDPEIGLRPMVTSDGPAGVRGTVRDERQPSANLPCPSALGATWDDELVGRVASALGEEARSKGVDILLAPTVNLMRTPLGGRGFEFFAEDPVLTARLAVAYVRGLQAAGVAATVKHYVGNESETGRWAYDARISETVLRELYLVPFEACVREAGAWLIMAAYNKVNGSPMTENLRLLRDVLKNEWGFDGVVTSDWHAARSTHATAAATLDLSMPGPEGPWGDLLTRAVRDGTVSEELLNDKVIRLLRLARRVGAFGADGALGAGATGTGTTGPARLVDPGLLRTVAAESFVLLRNGGALPLDLSAIRTLAVIGPNALYPAIQGGGSAGVTPASVSTPADGLRAALADRAKVVTAPGCRTWHTLPEPPLSSLRDPVTGTVGVRLEFTDGDGTVLATEHRESVNLTWWDTPDDIGWGKSGRVVLTALFRAESSADYEFGVAGVGGLTLTAGGDTLIDGATAVPEDPVEAMTRPGELRAIRRLEAGSETALRLEFRPAPDGAGPLSVRLGIVPAADDETLLAEAEVTAAGADVAIVVVGSAELTESEGFDRATLSLPGRQDELVRRVAAASPATIVVVNSGMPVLMPWAELPGVTAVVHAWMPGQAFGDALADVLLGDAEPGGRLPVSLPADEADAPVLHATPGPDGTLRYDEGLLVGYRGYDASGIEPRYPFGHGLGYTDWAYESLDSRGGVVEAVDLEVAVTVRNTGQRPGKEVIQVYLAGPNHASGRPPKALAAFAVVRAEPGERVTARLTIPARAFARYDEDLASWIWPGGVWTLHAGRSSRDLPLSASVRCGPGAGGGAGAPA